MNITLIGMPGSGKSTVGVLLAKTLVYDFVDTDILIQKKSGISLCGLIELEGTDGFIRTENSVISSVKAKNTVIATGGSAVYGKEAMEHLRNISTVVYLTVPLKELSDRIKNIKTRGIVMQNGQSLSDVFAERSALYEKYAHITVNCSSLSAEECVCEVINAVNKYTEGKADDEE